MSTQDKLLNVAEAASMLGLRPKTLYSFVAQRRVPYVKVLGRSLRFRESALRKIIEESTIPVREREQ